MKTRKPRHPKRMINPPACPRCTYEKARADDAQNQFNGMREQRDHWKSLCDACNDGRGVLSLTCELSREAYEDAQMHARTEHSLLTEAKAEIEKLRKQNLEEIQPIKADLADLKDGLLRQNGRLLADLALSDGIRRQQERDILAQQAELARWKPFNVRSKALG